MGSCCTKPRERPPDANRHVVVENAAFDAVRAAGGSGGGIARPPHGRPRAATATPKSAPRKLQVVRGKAVAVRGGKQLESAQRHRRITLSARGPARQQHPAGERQGQQAARTHGTKKKANIANSHPSSAAAVGGSHHPQPVKIQRLKLSAAVLARKCAGLGFGASYADSGAAKVKKAIAKLEEGSTLTGAALAAYNKSGQLPAELLEAAKEEVVRAVGITRIGVLIAEQQVEEIAETEGSDSSPLLEDRRKLLGTLAAQLALASKWNIEKMIGKKLNAQVDRAAALSAADFASSIPIVADAGLDMRVVFGVLALREAKSKVATEALHFDVPVETQSYSGRFLDFREFHEKVQSSHAAAKSKLDISSVAAAKQMASLFPGFMTAKVDAMAELVPAILKDVSVYNAIFKSVINSTPQVTVDALKTLAAAPSQLPDWKSNVKNHPGDPAANTLEYVMVARHRAGADSMHFYNTVHALLATSLPGECRAAAMPGLVKAAPRFVFKSVLSYVVDAKIESKKDGYGRNFTVINYVNGECFGRCNDLVRLTIRVETMDEMLLVLQCIQGSDVLWVLRQKNRMDPDKDMSMAGGYRDYQLLVAFKRDAASVARDGGAEYGVAEIQINLAAFIDVKEGVAAGGGGGHAPYKKARGFSGYSPETVAYNGAPSMELAKKIGSGMLLSVTIGAGSESGVDNLEKVGEAMLKGLSTAECRVQRLDLGVASDAQNRITTNSRLADILFSSGQCQLPVGLVHLGAGGASRLPENLAKCIHLQSLNLRGCSNLTMLPEGLRELVNLQSLNLHWCTNLTMLPDLSHLLPKLKIENMPTHLSDWGDRGFVAYNFMTDEPSTGAETTKLTLSGFNGNELPGWMSKLVNLQSLDLSSCKSLAEPLPDLSHLLPALKVENVDYASLSVQAWNKRGLFALKDGPSSPVTTTVLDLSLFAASELPDWVSKLVNLQSLNLSSCKNLTMLPEGLGKLVNLQSLGLSGCWSLTTLPEWLSKLVNLQSLDLSICLNLTTLPEGLGKLVNLQSLNLSFCSNLTMLPEGLGELVNLQSLNLSRCENLTMLPEGLGELVNLQSLNLSRCENLTMLPEGLSKLVHLQSLNLDGCKSLTEPLPDLSHLLLVLEINTYDASDAAQAWGKRLLADIDIDSDSDY